MAVTAQHREMLDQALAFSHRARLRLGPDAPGQTPPQIVAGVLEGSGPSWKGNGPTSSLSTGYGDHRGRGAGRLFLKIPVGHVEAGLRTQDRYDPFPEEMDRRLAGVLSTLHFAPTEWASNLLQENVDPGSIYVTGNTAIDALFAALREDYRFEDPRVEEAVASGRRLVLLTAHRRENWGVPWNGFSAPPGSSWSATRTS